MINLSAAKTTKEATNQIADLLVIRNAMNAADDKVVVIGHGLNDFWDALHHYINHKSVTVVLTKIIKENDDFRFTEAELQLLDSLINNDRSVDEAPLPEDHPYILFQQTKALMDKEKNGVKDNALARELNSKWINFISNLLDDIQKKDPKNIKSFSSINELDLAELEQFFAESLKSRKPLDPTLSFAGLTKALEKAYKDNNKQLSTKSFLFLATYGKSRYILSPAFLELFKSNIKAFASDEGIQDLQVIMGSPHIQPTHKIEILICLLSDQDMQPAMKDIKTFFSKVLENSNWVSALEFANVISKSKNVNITKEIKEAALGIIQNVNANFPKIAQGGMEVLTEEKFTRLSSLTDNQSLRNVMFKIGLYLNNSTVPLESRIKLFTCTFRKLSTEILPNSPLLQSSTEGNCAWMFNHYLKFILENWQQSEVKTALQKWGGDFFNDIAELDPTVIPNVLIAKLHAESFKKPFKQEFPEYYHKIQIVTEMAGLGINEKMEILRNPNIKDKMKKLSTVLPTMHKKYLQPFSIMISVTPDTEIKKLYRKPLVSPILAKVFYNHNGYDAGITFKGSQHHVKGKPLTLDGTPIGYNIHLPKKKMQGIFVNVYGGGKANERLKKLRQPGDLDDVSTELLNKGYAVVTLNLVDLIKNDNYQMEMSQEVHQALHDSINKFYDTLKNNPEKLDPALDQLKDLPIYLYGGSFGGRTAVKHAELYPGTFNGYISFDGALSFEMLQGSDVGLAKRKYTPRRMACAAWLDPGNDNDIKKISEPILLLHNMNDNNVNPKVTFHWYQRAKKANKQHLISLHVTEKGNPTVKFELHDTGHFPAKNEEDFMAMLDAMDSFMQKGAPLLPNLHHWRKLKYNILANKNFRSGTLEQRFVSESYALYHRDNRHKKLKFNEETWQKDYVPLYYTLHYLYALEGKPDLCAQKIRELLDSGELTEEVITRSLELHLKTFVNFVKELEGLKITPQEFDINYLVNDVTIREEYLRALREDKESAHYLLSTIYRANQQLLVPKLGYEHDLKIQENLQKAREKLNYKIEKEEKQILGVWGELTKMVQQNVKDQRSAINATEENAEEEKEKKPITKKPKKTKT